MKTNNNFVMVSEGATGGFLPQTQSFSSNNSRYVAEPDLEYDMVDSDESHELERHVDLSTDSKINSGKLFGKSKKSSDGCNVS